MITSLLSITFRSSRMNAFEEESRIKDESTGANVRPAEGPSSGSCWIAALAAREATVCLVVAVPVTGCGVSSESISMAGAYLRFAIRHSLLFGCFT